MTAATTSLGSFRGEFCQALAANLITSLDDPTRYEASKMDEASLKDLCLSIVESIDAGDISASVPQLFASVGADQALALLAAYSAQHYNYSFTWPRGYGSVHELSQATLAAVVGAEWSAETSLQDLTTDWMVELLRRGS